MRAYYLPASWSGNGVPQGRSARGPAPGQDSSALLDYPLTTSCFWIVSRGNNCHYCLGHQELKLRAAGLDEDSIAALDSDWSQFDPKLQAALGYARKLTLEPYLVADADIEQLRRVMTEAEILELTFAIARFNATNRWTDGLGIPQDEQFHGQNATLDTPTSPAFQHTRSIVAPSTRATRPQPPEYDELIRAVEACQHQRIRVALPSAKTGRPLWEQAMSRLPEAGAATIAAWNTVLGDDHLSPRLKAEVALISAAHNQAWYAAGHAIQRLRRSGAAPSDIAALLQAPPSNAAGQAAAHRLAARLTTHPHLITDDDIAQVRSSFDDRETAQLVHVICMANQFDRFTEALGLPLEAEIMVP